MAGKKDQSVVAVITGLTGKQAGDIISAFSVAKNKFAPLARGTAVQANRQDIGTAISTGVNNLKKLTSGGK
jgi:hypothetical protein